MRRVFLLLLALCVPAFGQLLSPLTKAPDWSELEPFQETITQEEFTRLLNEIYAPREAARDYVTISPAGAVIKTTLAPPATFTLRFAAPGAVKSVSQPWRPAAAFGPAVPDKPLAGAKIALDPGHLGGKWARMEERFFQLGESKPVQEGDLTLRVAKLLAPRLEQLGAQVFLVRSENEPITPLRPETLRAQARAELIRESQPAHPEIYDHPENPAVKTESELLFYRKSEIRARARLVNEKLKPDLTVCLHFNAEGWGDPERPQFVPRNHLHVLINGCYSAGELRYDDIRFEMLHKLLSRCYPEELAAARAVAESLATATGLPPYHYITPNAVRIPGTEYLWARNLLANRLYRTPVIFLEPYVMNCELVWERVQLGDYEGEITIGGASRKSIFREYAEAVAEGLRAHFTRARSPAQ